MNAQERLRRKRKKQMYRKLGVLLPIAVIILLIVGLTAGGIILSVNQTRKSTPGTSGSGSIGGKQDADKQSEGDDASEEEDGSDGEEPGNGAGESTEDPAAPSDEDSFETMLADLRAGQAADSTYLTPANAGFDTISRQLQQLDASSFSETGRNLYDVLLDKVQIEAQGASYVDSAPAAGQALCGVAGGTEYYTWLIGALSGSSRELQEMHDMLANELNENAQAVVALLQADVSVAQSAVSATKNGADNAYLFGTVTGESDPLLASIACDGLTNGWAEFGLIRAYQMDESLSGSENLKNYLIGCTRMTYAMYGLLDIYIHCHGWNVQQVTDLCNQYFGGGQENFAAELYQKILDKPGRWAAAGIGYLELISIEETLRSNTADYSEQVLLDFLFKRGPASFRVYWSWLQP